MANLTILLLSIGVLAYSVQCTSLPEKDEERLLYLLRKALSIYGKSSKGSGVVAHGNDGFKGKGGPSTPGRKLVEPEDLDIYYNFPGSDFMGRMALDWIETPLPQTVDTILNEFTRPTFDQSVVESLFSIAGQDRDMFATFMARLLTRAVFDVHVNCPSSVLSKFMTAAWLKTKDSYFGETSGLYTLYNTYIPRFFPGFAEDPDFLKNMVEEMIKHTNEDLLVDTERLILGLGFLDVARFAEDVYETFAQWTDQTAPIMQDILPGLLEENEVRCRTWSEMYGTQEFAIDSFLSWFGPEESASITKSVSRFLLRNLRDVAEATGQDLATINSRVNRRVLRNITIGITDFISKTVIPDMTSYLTVVTNRETVTFLGYFGFLSVDEMRVLIDVLTRLGWQAPPQTTTASPARRMVAINKLFRGRGAQW